ncbi:Microtubule-associated tumor suppressor candidate 2 [Nibea albiflora]|uniref:Microtubule-associated tumor suppressor candidate 2 n=1 Tax=Nibea albiflora TaxID=240163 RepID=A0ACB7F1G6_NIBAL|nr:Microtubule-associated tumor suppressor candidate 2 [Nibea albiflora]
MSIPTGYQGLRVNVDRGERIGNKTQIQFPQSGDDNANRLSSVAHQEGGRLIEDAGYNTSSIPPLVSQSESPNKLVIWGSEQQCVEPELREFELLDCQEIHTFLGNRDQDEDEDDGGSMRDGKDEGPMSISSSSTASSASIGAKRNDNDNNKVEGRVQRGREVQRRIACHSTEELDMCVTGSIEKMDTRSGRARERERQKGGLKESKSETNVFVSSLSAVSLSGSLSSALDSSGEAPSLIKTNPYSNTNNTTSAQTRRRAGPVEANQNSPPSYPQEKHGRPQYYSQDQRQEEGSHHRNGLSSDGVLGQRRKAGFEERVMPPRRQQLVRPLCQTEMVRARSSAEPSAHQAETGQASSTNQSPDSHINGSNRKFTKSALREPSDFSSLYTSGVSQLRQPNQAAQREAPLAEKQQAATVWRNASPSTSENRPQTQLTYRRNCSSPNRTGVDSRSSTPPQSPLRTPQGSPRRQPSMYLVSRNVSGVVRHIPSGCNPAVTTSAQGYGNSCMRAPVKTNISTSGIPKAPLNNQQSSHHNSGPKESSPSPKLKPKGVRPKIITYVRKNPQFKPQVSDGPYQVSSLPSRLSTYAHSQTAAPKEPAKPDAETRGAPVLSASNLLYDKYRQEMQTSIFPSGVVSRSIRPPGHTHTVPPTHTHSHTAPPKLGSKAENFYGAPSEVGRSGGFKGSAGEGALQTRTAAQAGGSGSLLRSGRGLRLGLGAVTRTTTGSAKGRGPGQGQRSAVFSQPVQPVSPATSQKSQDNTDDQVFTHHAPAAPSPATAAAQPQVAASRSLLPKASQSGLRPPGFSSSRLPAGRLAAFGFVRSSSVSSVSSAHSADSTQSDPCRTAHPFNSARWERLHREKTALEVAFERELQELQLQQEAELAAVEEGLRKCHSAEAEHLRTEHRSEMEELRTQQQEQVEEMTVNHQAAIQELRDMHNITMATLHEEHARTMRDLRKAHEQQKMLLEEDFEKLRLSLQDQVDTLTFQNQSLRDKAKRFEEALRRSTDEQIVDALAPYQHIEEDLKSLKEVVEMKNQQIHQQEKKISDLEKVAQKNVFLEEKVQVLQQQNEDLKARIQLNLTLSRQLSEENANLHESVEKESTEKKRLSRNNEELLWRLQTSPLMSPASSPLHRSFSTSPLPSSPFLSSSPVAGCDSPTHCHGCPQQAQYCSPSHRAAANQNFSPGPCHTHTQGRKQSELFPWPGHAHTQSVSQSL